MKNTILILIAVLLFSLVYSNSYKIYHDTIDIECNYDFKRDKKFNDFLEKVINKKPFQVELYKEKKWWEFWLIRHIYFSINLTTQQVTGGISSDGYYLPNNTSALIYPDELDIEQKFSDQNKNNSKHLKNRFLVNRINGTMYGYHYEVDPVTKQDIEKYTLLGKCKPIRRLF